MDVTFAKLEFDRTTVGHKIWGPVAPRFGAQPFFRGLAPGRRAEGVDRVYFTLPNDLFNVGRAFIKVSVISMRPADSILFKIIFMGGK